MIYYILGLMLAFQALSCHLILKKRKPHIPSVNYSSEDPAIGHIVLWSVGDIWINYETLTCFMLVSKGFNRRWKVIGATSIKYTKAQRKVLEDPKLVKQYKENMKGK